MHFCEGQLNRCVVIRRSHSNTKERIHSETVPMFPQLNYLKLVFHHFHIFRQAENWCECKKKENEKSTSMSSITHIPSATTQYTEAMAEENI